MRQERYEFSGRKFFPIQIQKEEFSTIAYLYNLSLDGFCIAIPKRSGKDFLNDLVLESESLFLNNKLHLSMLDVNDAMTVEVGDRLQVKMAPFRMDKVTCEFEVLHARDDENYYYFGGKTYYQDQQSRAKVEEELSGIKKREKTSTKKMTPIKGAIWFFANLGVFSFLVSYIN